MVEELTLEKIEEAMSETGLDVSLHLYSYGVDVGLDKRNILPTESTFGTLPGRTMQTRELSLKFTQEIITDYLKSVQGILKDFFDIDFRKLEWEISSSEFY